MTPRLAAPAEIAAAARRILEALPDWFAIASAREAYIREAATLSCWLAAGPDDQPLGFATLKPQTEAAAELHLIAVLPQWHGQGHGSRLLAAAETAARQRGHRLLTVKTLAPSHPDPGYAATRRFYEARGFLPLELFPTLWGAENPCLLMVKVLS